MKRPRWLYHCTQADKLPSIARDGLRPSHDPHWGGMLGEESVGWLYAADTSKAALYYGLILFRKQLENDRHAFLPVLLRFCWSKLFEPLRDAPGEYRSEAPVDSRIEMYWQEKWHPVEALADAVAEADFKSTVVDPEEGEVYEDWEGDIYSTIADVEELVKELYRKAG